MKFPIHRESQQRISWASARHHILIVFSPVFCRLRCQQATGPTSDTLSKRRSPPMQQTGEKAPGHASPRMVLVLALVLATAVGPVWLSPAGAASSVVSSDIIPLNGEVG